MNARRVPVIVLLVAALALVAGLAACGGSGGGSSSGSSPAALPSPGGGGTVTLWHGYTDVERDGHRRSSSPSTTPPTPADAVKSVFAGNNDYALQKLLTALAAGKAPDIAYQYGSSLAQPRRPRPRSSTCRRSSNDAVLRLERLLSRPRGWRARSNGKVIGVPGAGRQPRARLQQEAVRRGRRRLPDQRLDLERLPRRGQEAHRPRDQAVRLGLRQRRQRGHGLALPRSAVAGRRRSAQRRQHEGRVRLAAPA